MEIAQIGEPVLAKPAQQVAEKEFSSAGLSGFVESLLSTMLEAKGVGIAAPQVFDSRAIMIIASKPNARYPDAPEMAPLVLVNPAIVEQSESRIGEWEGCLSVPGLRGKISRSDWVIVRFQNIDGETEQRKFEGFVARIFLHEYDHLIGKTWLDHVSSSQDIMAESVWLKRIS